MFQSITQNIKFRPAIIPIRKVILPQRHNDTGQLRAESAVKFASLTELYSKVCT